MKNSNNLMTTGQVAKMSGVHINVVKKWITDGLLSAFRLPAGHFRIEQEEYRRFLRASGMPTPEALADSADGSGQCRRILLIDDDQAQVELMKAFLEQQGFSIETALDGYVGLIRIGSFRPDLVFLDINMPRLDGIEVLDALFKQTASDSQIPLPNIIVMSGEQDPEVQQKLSEYPVADLIRKPFSLGGVLDSLKSIYSEVA